VVLISTICPYTEWAVLVFRQTVVLNLPERFILPVLPVRFDRELLIPINF